MEKNGEIPFPENSERKSRITKENQKSRAENIERKKERKDSQRKKKPGNF